MPLFVSSDHLNFLSEFACKLKTIAAFFTLTLLLGAQLRSQVPTDQPLTTVTFSERVFDFGSVFAGAKPVHQFMVTNTGKANLVLDSVITNCHCIRSRWRRDVIAPGQTGWVEVKVNAATVGPFSKSIVLRANVPLDQRTLTIEGEVKEKDPNDPNGGTRKNCRNDVLKERTK